MKRNKNDAANVRRQIQSIQIQITKLDAAADYLTLGLLVHQVRQARLFVGWGFSTFREFARAEITLSPRTVSGVVRIHRHLALHLKVPADQLRAIGWRKATLVASIADEETLADWMALAAEKTETELRAAIREARQASKPERHRLAFTLDDEEFRIVGQALHHVMDGVGKMGKGAALTVIAREFLKDHDSGPDLAGVHGRDDVLDEQVPTPRGTAAEGL